MGTTRYFSLAFFDFGDQLDSALNVNKEIDRFVLIDKQLYGLYSIFGNGVIEGWSVTDGGTSQEEGITVNISTGLGIINFIASQTDLPGSVINIPPNSVSYIYAVLTGSSTRTRVINFNRTSTLSAGSNAILLAKVVTSSNAVSVIDNTIRDLISFEQVIQDKIDEHRHRGTPSKIDLQEEVKNQLPGARIENLDASKITSGVLDAGTIPLIDHNELENKGLLTHAALDSFVRSLSQNNKELLGEIATTNLLKTAIFLKYLYTNVDEQWVNEFILIPGISPDSFIDFAASTANIDLDNQCISGKPAQTGLFTSVYWRDQQSLSNTSYQNNVVIANGEVSLDRSGSNVLQIEGFNNFGQGQGSVINAFTSEIVSTGETVNVTADISDQNKVEGDAAGSFQASTSLQARYTKDLRTDIANNIGQNWSNDYDEFVVWVKTISQVHEAVYLKIITYNLSTNKEVELPEVTLIEKDHATTNTDATKNEFEKVIVDLRDLDVSNVTKIMFYTDEISETFSFLADDMYVQRENLVVPSGTVRYRYFTDTDIIFHSIWYEAVTPANTEVQVRVKTSSSTSLLNRSSYSLPINSGDIFALAGSAIEIEIILLSDDNTTSPVFDYLELRLLVDGDFNGWEINTSSEWNEGTLQNITVEETGTEDASLIISSPINVGGFYFGQNDSVSEMSDLNVGKIGFSGSLMPISSNQALNWSSNPYRKFEYLTSVVRKFNKNYLIADTNNDRILEVDSTGALVKGYGSSYATVEADDLFPLSFVYNQETHVLSIAFTKASELQDITKISFYIGTLKFPLTSNDTLISFNKSGGRVIEIQLYDDTWVALANLTTSHTEDVTVSIESEAFTAEIEDTSGDLMAPGAFGWPCFVGDFTYIDNISHPIFVDILDSGNWIVANALINYDIATELGVENENNAPSILEFNPDTGLEVYSSEDVIFSDFTLGSILEYEEDRFLIAGLKPGETIDSAVDSEDIRNSGTSKAYFRAAAVDSLTDYRGKLIILDKANNKFTTLYSSPDGLYPSDVDLYADSNILIAESSFAEASGRLIKLDSFGNVTWAYGNGTFNIIRDAKVVSVDNIMVSL
jgi:hypothetical protein